MNTQYAQGDKVSTPNGPGWFEGQMWECGSHWVLVRHVLAEMAGTLKGVCETPKAKITTLFRYDAKDVKSV